MPTVIRTCVGKTGQILPIPRTKKGLSQSTRVWSEYEPQHPFLGAWIAYEGLAKLCQFFAGLRAPVVHPSYRGLVPMDRLPFLGEAQRHLTFWFGPRRHLLTFPVARGELMNMVAFVPADDAWAEESWTAPGEVDVLARHFEGWEAAAAVAGETAP